MLKAQIDIDRPCRVFLIALPFSLLYAAILMFTTDGISADEMAVMTIAPLWCAYIVLKGITRSTPTVDPPEHRRRSLEFDPGIGLVVLASIFSLGFFLLIVFAMSMIVYWTMDLAGALSWTRIAIRWLAYTVGAAAILLCLPTICRMFLVRIGSWTRRVLHSDLRHPLGGQA